MNIFYLILMMLAFINCNLFATQYDSILQDNFLENASALSNHLHINHPTNDWGDAFKHVIHHLYYSYEDKALKYEKNNPFDGISKCIQNELPQPSTLILEDSLDIEYFLQHLLNQRFHLASIRKIEMYFSKNINNGTTLQKLLKELGLFNPNSANDDIQFIVPSLKNLTSLTISVADKSHLIIVVELLSHLKNLKHLTLIDERWDNFNKYKPAKDEVTQLVNTLTTLISLEELSLRGNQLGKYPAELAHILLPLTALKHLALIGNALGNNQQSTFQQIAIAISHLTELKSLNLSQNDFGITHSDNINFLSQDLLPQLNKLEALDLSGNTLGLRKDKDTLFKLFESIERLTTLKKLSLELNLFSEQQQSLWNVLKSLKVPQLTLIDAHSLY